MGTTDRMRRKVRGGRPQPSLIAGLHPVFLGAEVFPAMLRAAQRGIAVMFDRCKNDCVDFYSQMQRFEHASSHYELVVPANRWLPVDFRVGRCALVRQRILRCRPDEDSTIRVAPDQSQRVLPGQGGYRDGFRRKRS